MKHRIIGDAMQTVAVEISPGESVFSRLGRLLFARGGIESEISPEGPYWNGVRAAIQSSENPPLVIYNCKSGNGLISFSIPGPGKIHILKLDGTRRMVVSRKAFLAASTGVQFDPIILEGEDPGRIPPRLFVTASGSGMLFLHGSGNLVDMNLNSGEIMIIDGMQLLAVDDGIDISPKPAGIPAGTREVPYVLLMQLTGPGRFVMQTVSVPV